MGVISGILSNNRKRKQSLQDIFNAIFYLLNTGGPWHMIPIYFPNWEQVYYYFTKWKNNGVVEQIQELLRYKMRKKARKNESAS